MSEPSKNIEPGDRLEWRTWTGETASAVVDHVSPFRISTTSPGIYFEATCFKTLEQALARVTVVKAAR